MPGSTNAENGGMQSPVATLLPEPRRMHLARYWQEYLALPGDSHPDELQLQADITAGVLLPPDSALHPSTAVAVATGLLQYHRCLGEGLAQAYNALVKLQQGESIRHPLDDYVISALQELSYRLSSLARNIKEESTIP